MSNYRKPRQYYRKKQIQPNVAAPSHQDQKDSDQEEGNKEQATPQEKREIDSKASPAMQEASGSKQENRNPEGQAKKKPVNVIAIPSRVMQESPGSKQENRNPEGQARKKPVNVIAIPSPVMQESPGSKQENRSPEGQAKKKPANVIAIPSPVTQESSGSKQENRNPEGQAKKKPINVIAIPSPVTQESSGSKQENRNPEGQATKKPVNVIAIPSQVMQESSGSKQEDRNPEGQAKRKPINVVAIPSMNLVQLMPPPPAKPPSDEDEEALTDDEARRFLETTIQKCLDTGMNPFYHEIMIRELMDSLKVECSMRQFRRLMRLSIDRFENNPWHVPNPRPLRNVIITDLKCRLHDVKISRKRVDRSQRDMKAKDGKKEEEKETVATSQQSTVEENKRPSVGIAIQEKPPEPPKQKKKISAGKEHPYLDSLISDITYRISFFMGLIDYREHWGIFPFESDSALLDFIRNWLELDLDCSLLTREMVAIREEYDSMSITSILETLNFWESPVREAFYLANRIWGIYTEPMYGAGTLRTEPNDDDDDSSSSEDGSDDFDTLGFVSDKGQKGDSTRPSSPERQQTGAETQETSQPEMPNSNESTITTTSPKPMDVDGGNIQEEDDSDEESLTADLARFYLEEILGSFCYTGTNPLDNESALRELLAWLDLGCSVGQFRKLIKRSLEMHEAYPWDIQVADPCKDEKLVELKNSCLVTVKENVDGDASQQETESRDNTKVSGGEIGREGID